MTTKEEKLRDKIRKLFALMGSENTAEREAARAKIMELLGKNKRTWNDLTECLATGNAKGWHDDEPAAVGGGKAAPAPLRPCSSSTTSSNAICTSRMLSASR
jgi:hypothetical protein